MEIKYLFEPLDLGDKQCDACKKVLEDDIFCHWHGKIDNQFLCDECVNGQRGSLHFALETALKKSFMDERKVRIMTGTVQGAIENLAEIKWIEAHDQAGSQRSVDLNLSFRESRPIYRALYKVLKKKLNESESFPA